ncbi:hypothetical protein CRG98_044518 [Punica granatum]|uniref:Uncharacterized protein n=1 Tax=Punica granatum TaxID=22663 RepID=A0A2I0HTQ0_PUNGR|nr:hypothetical protein CRG98_044518 [Punica granatum]
MQNQRVKPGNVKKGCLVKLNAELTSQAPKGEEGESLLKVNAESTELTSQAPKGEEGESLLKVNAESTGKARKCEEGVLG